MAKPASNPGWLSPALRLHARLKRRSPGEATPPRLSPDTVESCYAAAQHLLAVDDVLQSNTSSGFGHLGGLGQCVVALESVDLRGAVGMSSSRGLLCWCPVGVSGCKNETDLVSLVTFSRSLSIICLSTCSRTPEREGRRIYMEFKTRQS